MTAIADQSDIVLWPWWVWAVLATAALVTLAARTLTHAPEQEPELSWLDEADGIGCSVAMCGERVTVHVHAGHEIWPFCQAHGTPHLTEGMTP